MPSSFLQIMELYLLATRRQKHFSKLWESASYLRQIGYHLLRRDPHLHFRFSRHHFRWQLPSPPPMSLSANPSFDPRPLNFLIHGKTRWIDGLLGRLFEERGVSYAYGAGRLENRVQLEGGIVAEAPTHVFNAAGITGRPYVDWCETHKVEITRANVAGMLNYIFPSWCDREVIWYMEEEIGHFVRYAKLYLQEAMLYCDCDNNITQLYT